MRVGIITPYYRETLDTLRTCHESVQAQTHACTHFMVADGFPNPELSAWPIKHIVLSDSHGDVGNTPRAIGSLSAMSLGFDAIAYLDADNGYYANHVDSMIKLLQQTRAAICTASRTIHRQDGSLMFTDPECDGSSHVDTSCYFFTKQAFRLLPLWGMMPPQLGPVGDRVMWNMIRFFGISCAHNQEPTVAFQGVRNTRLTTGYASAGDSADWSKGNRRQSMGMVARSN